MKITSTIPQNLPSSTDAVFLYSSKTKIDKTKLTGKPMLVGDGVNATTGKFFIGDPDNGYLIGVRVCNGGTMTNGDAVYAGAKENGYSDDTGVEGAYLEVENGGLWTANSNFYLGLSKGTSYLNVKAGGTFACSNEFVVGQAYGNAVVTNAGTMNIRNFFIGGPQATGRMEVTGTLNVASKFTLGRHANSTADLHLAKGATFVKQYGDGKPVYIGHASNSTATVALDCNLTLTSSDKIYIGSGDFGRGRLIVGENATVDNVHSLYLGAANGSDGTLELRGGTVSFRRFVSDLTGVGCGVCNLSEKNVGAAVTLELRLRETCSGETKTLVRRDFRLSGGRTKPWFDGRIPNCESWPADAALALGGAWRADAIPLADVASRTPAGGLELSGRGPLDFDLTEHKSLGADITTATVNFELEFAPSFVNDLPTVAADWKGGVLIALDGADIGYYGLAKVGDRNAWVKLEGRPPVFNGGPVHVQMTLHTATDGRTTIAYLIDGEAYAYGGQTEIDLVVPSSLGGVSFNGRGRVLSLDGSFERAKTGLSVFAW